MRLNPEFVRRYLFAAAVFIGLGGWFGYDGLVRYPATPARVLYEQIERASAPEGMPESAIDAFKDQKIKTQLGMMSVLLLVGFGVLLVLYRAWKFDFDPSRPPRIKSVDRRQWDKKGILRVETESGWITLDSWHHSDVVGFEKTLNSPLTGSPDK